MRKMDKKQHSSYQSNIIGLPLICLNLTTNTIERKMLNNSNYKNGGLI